MLFHTETTKQLSTSIVQLHNAQSNPESAAQIHHKKETGSRHQNDLKNIPSVLPRWRFQKSPVEYSGERLQYQAYVLSSALQN